MPIHRFTLIVDGLDLQDDTLADEVFEAECDDAAVGRIDDVQYVDFDREAASAAAVAVALAATRQRAMVSRMSPVNISAT